MACLRLFTQTAAEWTAENPRHERGAIGVEVNDAGVYGKAKIFDGVTRWNSLGYWSPGGASGGGGTFETAEETPDGVEDTFTFSGTPVMVFRNGVNETRLGTIGDGAFVFDTPPAEGDDVEGFI